MAVAGGYENIVSLLLESGADSSIRGSMGDRLAQVCAPQP